MEGGDASFFKGLSALVGGGVAARRPANYSPEIGDARAPPPLRTPDKTAIASRNSANGLPLSRGKKPQCTHGSLKNCSVCLQMPSDGPSQGVSNKKKMERHQRSLMRRSLSAQFLTDLPPDIMLTILEFLHPDTIASVVSLLCYRCHQLASLKELWSDRLPNLYPVTDLLEPQPGSPVVERRSKGKVQVARVKGTKQKLVLRTVSLVVSNAGRDDGVPTSCLRELSLISDLDHPNILKCYGGLIEGSDLKVVWEFGGEPLVSYVCFLKPPPPPSLLRHYLRQVFLAVDALHARGIMHRNIKSDNILVRASPEDPEKSLVKLCDLAMARPLDYPLGAYTPEDPKERDRSCREQRRLFNRAPEIILRQTIYGSEIDMWSLGCIFLEIFLQRPPFRSESEIGVLVSAFQLCGTPDVSLWDRLGTQPELLPKLPHWIPIDFRAVAVVLSDEKLRQQGINCPYLQPYARQADAVQMLLSFGSAAGIAALQLLERLLVVPGCFRVSVAEALRFPYFTTPPNEDPDRHPAVQAWMQSFLNRPATKHDVISTSDESIAHFDRFIAASKSEPWSFESHWKVLEAMEERSTRLPCRFDLIAHVRFDFNEELDRIQKKTDLKDEDGPPAFPLMRSPEASSPVRASTVSRNAIANAASVQRRQRRAMRRRRQSVTPTEIESSEHASQGGDGAGDVTLLRNCDSGQTTTAGTSSVPMQDVTSDISSLSSSDQRLQHRPPRGSEGRGRRRDFHACSGEGESAHSAANTNLGFDIEYPLLLGGASSSPDGRPSQRPDHDEVRPPHSRRLSIHTLPDLHHDDSEDLSSSSMQLVTSKRSQTTAAAGGAEFIDLAGETSDMMLPPNKDSSEACCTSGGSSELSSSTSSVEDLADVAPGQTCDDPVLLESLSSSSTSLSSLDEGSQGVHHCDGGFVHRHRERDARPRRNSAYQPRGAICGVRRRRLALSQSPLNANKISGAMSHSHQPNSAFEAPAAGLLPVSREVPARRHPLCRWGRKWERLAETLNPSYHWSTSLQSPFSRSPFTAGRRRRGRSKRDFLAACITQSPHHRANPEQTQDVAPHMQPRISPRTRMDLVNYLFAVRPEFLLKSQTVHTAVGILDRYACFLIGYPDEFSAVDYIPVALACLKIADLSGEISKEYYKQDNLAEYCGFASSPPACFTNLTDGRGYKLSSVSIEPAELLAEEKKILNTLRFEILVPTVSWFLDFYLSVARLLHLTYLVDYAHYLADLSLMSHCLLAYRPALVAQVIMLIAATAFVRPASVRGSAFSARPRSRWRVQGRGSGGQPAHQKNGWNAVMQVLERLLRHFLIHRERLCARNTAWETLECAAIFRELLTDGRRYFDAVHLNNLERMQPWITRLVVVTCAIPPALIQIILPPSQDAILASYC